MIRINLVLLRRLGIAFLLVCCGIVVGVVSESAIATNDPHAAYQPAPSTFETRQLFDAFEGRTLAIIRVYSDRPGDPIVCSVELPSGENKSCRNELEWESLTRVYLER